MGNQDLSILLQQIAIQAVKSIEEAGAKRAGTGTASSFKGQFPADAHGRDAGDSCREGVADGGKGADEG